MLNLKTFIKHSSGYHLQNAILTQDLILSILKKDRISFAEYIIGRGGNSFDFGKIWVWIYVSVNLIQLTVAKILWICWLYQFLWNYFIFSLDQSFFECRWNLEKRKFEHSNIESQIASTRWSQRLNIGSMITQATTLWTLITGTLPGNTDHKNLKSAKRWIAQELQTSKVQW